MFISAFDLFKIGLGPSSSHTVGPMRAALRFVRTLSSENKLDATTLLRRSYYSVGGGFVVEENGALTASDAMPKLRVPYPFASAAELLQHGETAHKRIPEMMRISELALRSPQQVRSGLLDRWA